MKMGRNLKKAFDKYHSLPVQARAAFWFLLCSFMQKGVSSITVPIFTRLLESTEFGQYNIFSSWLGIIGVFVSLNLYCGVYMQGLVKHEEKRDIYSSSLQGLTITLIAGWSIVYLLFRSFWNTLFQLTTIQMIAMLAMIWATAAFSFWASYQRVDFKYRKLVLATIAVSVAKPVAGIVFVLHAEDKVTAMILGTALVEVIGYSGFCISQMARGRKFFVSRFWKHALSFNLPLIPHYLSLIVLHSSDRIMIGRMAGESPAGIYSLAYSVASIMILFNTALVQTLEPWRYKKLKEGRPEKIAQIFAPSLLLIAGLNLFTIVLAPEIVALFAPPAYYDAIWVIPPVAMSVYFMFTYGYFAVFEFYYEKTKYVMWATTAGAVLNIALNCLFIPLCGYYVAGYTTLLCYIVYAGAHYYFMRRICRTELGGRKVYRMKWPCVISLGFMAAGFAVMATYTRPLLRYSILVVLAGIVLCRYRSLLTLLRQFGSLRKTTA